MYLYISLQQLHIFQSRPIFSTAFSVGKKFDDAALSGTWITQVDQGDQGLELFAETYMMQTKMGRGLPNKKESTNQSQATLKNVLVFFFVNEF